VTYLEAAVLGVIQGLTEFLPVSSSGHLVIFQSWFGLEGPQLLFDVGVHVGTLIAVVVVFRRDLLNMAKAVLQLASRSDRNPNAESLVLLKWVIIGTIPAGVAGVLGVDFFESIFGKPVMAALLLIVTGAILVSTRWVSRGEVSVSGMTWRHTLAVGVAQAVAIFPGISRSGTTIVCGLWTGLERDVAVRFSFLLAIPAILGAAVLQIPDLLANNHDVSVLGPVIVGGLIAGITGFVAIRWLIKLVARGKLHPFAYYCWAFAAVALVVHFLGN